MNNSVCFIVAAFFCFFTSVDSLQCYACTDCPKVTSAQLITCSAQPTTTTAMPTTTSPETNTTLPSNTTTTTNATETPTTTTSTSTAATSTMTVTTSSTTSAPTTTNLTEATNDTSTSTSENSTTTVTISSTTSAPTTTNLTEATNDTSTTSSSTPTSTTTLSTTTQLPNLSNNSTHALRNKRNVVQGHDKFYTPAILDTDRATESFYCFKATIRNENNTEEVLRGCGHFGSSNHTICNELTGSHVKHCETCTTDKCNDGNYLKSSVILLLSLYSLVTIPML